MAKLSLGSEVVGEELDRLLKVKHRGLRVTKLHVRNAAILEGVGKVMPAVNRGGEVGDRLDQRGAVRKPFAVATVCGKHPQSEMGPGVVRVQLDGDLDVSLSRRQLATEQVRVGLQLVELRAPPRSLLGEPRREDVRQDASGKRCASEADGSAT